MGAIFGGGVALAFHGAETRWCCPRCSSRACARRHAVGGHSRVPAHALQRQRDPRLADARLRRASLVLSLLVHERVARSGRLQLPADRRCSPTARCYPICCPKTRLNVGFLVALAAVALGWLFMRKSLPGLPDARRGSRAGRGRELRRHLDARRTVWLGMLIGGACAGLAGVGEVAGPIGQLLPIISPGYGFAAIIVAFVGRLHPVGIFFASLLMSLLYLGGEAAQMGLALPSSVTGPVPGHAAVLPARGRRVHPLSAARRAGTPPRRRRRPAYGHSSHLVLAARSPPARRSCSRRWASSSPKSPGC